MEEGMGISGLLSPEGKFYEAGHMYHHIVAEEIIKEMGYAGSVDHLDLHWQQGWCVFGSKGKYYPAASYIFMPIVPLPTKAQLDWIKEKFNEFDEIQKKEILKVAKELNYETSILP